MPFPFTCDHCGMETLVDDEFAGQSGPCAGCGRLINVPYSPFTTPIAAGDAIVKSRTNWTIVSIVVLAGIIAAGAAFVVLFTVVFPATRIVAQEFQRGQCNSNLRRIGEALRSYEVQYGTLPPAFIPDANGKPMHSWRVLILPQLGEHGLYAQYNFNEPWDGPANSLLMLKMPEVYACPADPDAMTKGESSYNVLVGEDTFFPGAKAVASREAHDELSSTLLVVEILVNGQTWLKPSDLTASRMQFTVNGSFAGDIGSFHTNGAHVLTADGSVKFLKNAVSPTDLEAMSTINGNESINWENLK